MNKDIAGLDIAVDQVLQMHLAQRRADLDRQLDKPGDPEIALPARRASSSNENGAYTSAKRPGTGWRPRREWPSCPAGDRATQTHFEQPGGPLFFFVADRGGNDKGAARMRMSGVHPEIPPSCASTVK